MRNDPGKIGMRPLSVCVFFLTLAGSCEKHGFGSNANTFIFQVGHPIEGMFVAAIPIEDAVVWARLRMRVWPSHETKGIMDSTAQS